MHAKFFFAFVISGCGALFASSTTLAESQAPIAVTGGFVVQERTVAASQRVAQAKGIAEKDSATAATLKKAYEEMGRDNGAAYWLLVGLANQGVAEAEKALGEMLSEGFSGIPVDYPAAINLYRRAWDHGYAPAALSLGSMHKRGKGTPTDYAAALAWYRNALDRGDALIQSFAQLEIARVYAEGGHGIPQDYVQAYRSFDVVAKHKSSVGIPDHGCPTDVIEGLACVAARERDVIAAKMTQDQIALARRLAFSEDNRSRNTEPYEGLWAQTKEHCLDHEGPNSRTLIDLGNIIDSKLTPIFDQYEHHCRIDTRKKSGSITTLTVTCYEFWEDFSAKKDGSPAAVTISLGKGGLQIDGKSYQLCKTIAAMKAK